MIRTEPPIPRVLVLLDSDIMTPAALSTLQQNLQIWATQLKLIVDILVDALPHAIQQWAIGGGARAAVVAQGADGRFARGAEQLAQCGVSQVIAVEVSSFKDAMQNTTRRWQTINGRGEKAYLWAMRTLRERARWPSTCISYGAHAEQLADLRLPLSGEHQAFPVVVIFHGGFWREPLKRDMLESVAIALTERGFATLNVEFRRVGGSGGGFPQSLEDAASALDALADVAGNLPLDLTRIALLGHSAGGHLALVTASARARAVFCQQGRVTPHAVVALAPVSDLTNAAQEELGSGAVSAFLGNASLDWPQVQLASPISLLPLGVPQLILHGKLDETVPLSQSVAYADAARQFSDEIQIQIWDDVGHMALTDPDTAAGQRAIDVIVNWLRSLPSVNLMKA